MSARTVAWIVLGGLLVALIVMVVLSTPWRPLGRVPADDLVAPRVAGDFTEAEVARSASFVSAVRPPAYLGLAAGLLTSVLLGLTPLGARLTRVVGGWVGGNWVLTVLLGTTVLVVLVRLVTVPFAAWTQGARRDAGLATQSWQAWLLDVAKGTGLQVVLAALALLVLVTLARAWPTWWWVLGGIGAALLVVLLSFSYPLLVEPVFNRFTPMADGPLRTSLLNLARRDGVPVQDVLVADASRRTTTLNAYVSGFGATRRIVVYDTLLTQAPDDEIRVVVAHELGHAKDNDVLHATLLGALAAAAAVVALGLLLSWRPALEAAGASAAGDPRVAALVLATVAIVSLATAPAQSLLSRRVESRADVHALELTKDPDTFAVMQKRLAVTSLSDLTPPALAYMWFATHPTAPQRIAVARMWANRAGIAPPGPLLDVGN